MSEPIRQRIEQTISMKEYAAVRDAGAGLLDLSLRGRILVSGSDATMFLNGLITNDVKALAVNSSMPAAFANVQGRLIAAVRVIRREDGFLIDTEAATHQAVFQLVSRFVLAGNFRVHDVTKETALLSIQGPRAVEIVGATLGESAATLEHGRASTAQFESNDVTVISATHTAEEGFDLVVDETAVATLREALIRAGAQTVGEEVFEVLRIEAGIPRYGIDMDQTTVISETNLDDAISFTKGCYVGQEIIIRIKHRGHVAKKLTGVFLEGPWAVADNAEIISDDHEEVGYITSYTYSPRLDRPIALAYLKYGHLEEGKRVWIDHGEKEFVAEVASLPMVRGSWYASEPARDRETETEAGDE
jgi:folate-binding protein YgfZ